MPRASPSTSYAPQRTLNDPSVTSIAMSVKNRRYSGICSISKVVTTTCWILHQYTFLAFSCHNWSPQSISDNSCNHIWGFKGFTGIFMAFWVGVNFNAFWGTINNPILIYHMNVNEIICSGLEIKHNYHTHHKKCKISWYILWVGILRQRI